MGKNFKAATAKGKTTKKPSNKPSKETEVKKGKLIEKPKGKALFQIVPDNDEAEEQF